ncbi:hypothetical protein YC2023_110585 [Brassica napus]
MENKLNREKKNEQVKGYGTRLMNHLKQHARDVDGLTHFLTHAQQCCWLFYQADVNQLVVLVHILVGE